MCGSAANTTENLPHYVCVIDIETTGLNPDEGAEIIEVAAIHWGGSTVHEFERIIQLKDTVPQDATAVHGITNEMLAKAEPLDIVLEQLIKFVGDLPLVGHNIQFDLQFLKRDLAAMGHTLTNPSHCTLKLSKQNLPEMSDHRLEKVYNYLFGPWEGDKKAHRAMADAQMTLQIWQKLRKLPTPPAKERMPQLSPTDLKTILHSKRANLYYLEHCRVMQKDGRVLYLTEDKKEKQYYNIPIANTTVILLGSGTSLTQAAARMLAAAGVLIGFCGGGGTPLFMGNEIEWLTPQSEYRPTEYVQGWLGFWFDEKARLDAAKKLQHGRIDYLCRIWAKDRELRLAGFDINDAAICQATDSFRIKIDYAVSTTELLSIEAQLTKQLYKCAAMSTGINNFARDRNAMDKANTFLNHGNYLAYGLGATTLWVLGIPHGFAVMHGKTRRGALVFDIADLVKDALVLPWAFVCAKENATEQEFRQQCIQAFADHKALDTMFDQVKALALTAREEAKR